MRGLEETKMLLLSLGQHYEHEKQPEVAKLFFRKAALVGKQARVVHASILEQEALSGDLQFAKKKVN